MNLNASASFLKRLSICLLLTCIFASITIAQSKSEFVNTVIRKAHQKGIFNGTVLISDNNKVIYHEALGYANTERGEKLQKNSAFYLASVSKQFTCMAIMMLKERGELTYDDKLASIFRQFPDYAEEVSIRHLMTHTSGIPDHYGLGAYKPGLTNEEVFELLLKQPQLDFEPGSTYKYSNGAYVLLAMIVEEVSGQPLSQFMAENIFNPLGMKNTLVMDERNPPVVNRTTGYNKKTRLDDYEIFTTGAGGMFTTVGDLYKWDQALYTEKLVKQKTLNEAYTSMLLNDGNPTYYGFGIAISKDPNDMYFSHTGSMNGYRTYMYRDTVRKDCIIMLTNQGDAFKRTEIAKSIQQILKDQELVLPRGRAKKLKPKK